MDVKKVIVVVVVDVKGDVDDILIFVAVVIVFRKIKQWMDQLLPNLK